MRKILVALALAAALAGCAELQKLEQAFTFVTGTTVPPQAIVVAANTFDGLQGTATQYLIYCKANLAQPVCSAANRRSVIKYVRAGRAARNQLEGYITQNVAAPATIYNVLIAAITNLQQSAANAGAVK